MALLPHMFRVGSNLATMLINNYVSVLFDEGSSLLLR